jgi:glyceraldehyde 3-phosphate dehydrogenase
MAYEQDGIEVVHINDLTEAAMLASLLQFDSTHGRWAHRVQAEGSFLHIDGTSVSVSKEKDPLRLPWADRGVEVVLEATGRFRKKAEAAKHCTAGAKKVLVSAPGKDDLDGNFVIGVNEDLYERDRHDVISIGSCTTNCLAPVAKVIHEELGIVHGLINTVHAYTASQNLVDGPSKTIRRGRAAAENLVPTTTGASATIGRIIPALDGKLQGLAVRAPVKCGSLLDLTCTTEKETSAEEVNQVLRKWASGPMRGILSVDDAALVSSDIIGTEESAIVSSQDTRVIGGHLLKVLAWYDNEWAFSRRCVDMMMRML